MKTKQIAIIIKTYNQDGTVTEQKLVRNVYTDDENTIRGALLNYVDDMAVSLRDYARIEIARDVE